MADADYQDLGSGISCIDAQYVQRGLACFYLLQQGDECAVIETGTSHSVAPLLQLLGNRGIQPEQIRYVIPTHVHLDHAGGAGAMMAAFPEAQLLIHPRGARHMVDPTRLVAGTMEVYGEELFVKLYGEIMAVDEARVRSIEDGETVSLVGRKLEFRHTRGHAEHHFCIWDAVSRGWFSGDMFGISYPWCRSSTDDFVLPSTTPSQFDPETFLASVDLLCSYHPQRLFLTHYGELLYTEKKADLLREQIGIYCELARTHANDPSALEASLAEQTIQLIRGTGLAGDEAQWRQSLVFDMGLNAQGLLIWLARTAAA